MDGQGNLASGFSASSSSIHLQLRYAGRLATDPLNTLGQGEAHLFDGAGSQTGSGNRWGDYSALTVDPVDDTTFWYTNEYYSSNTSYNWRTRIGSFKLATGAPTPTPSPTPTPVVSPTPTPTPAVSMASSAVAGAAAKQIDDRSAAAIKFARFIGSASKKKFVPHGVHAVARIPITSDAEIVAAGFVVEVVVEAAELAVLKAHACEAGAARITAIWRTIDEVPVRFFDCVFAIALGTAHALA